MTLEELTGPSLLTLMAISILTKPPSKIGFVHVGATEGEGVATIWPSEVMRAFK